jgi:lysophospholipase L1-like esterase
MFRMGRRTSFAGLAMAGTLTVASVGVSTAVEALHKSPRRGTDRTASRTLPTRWINTWVSMPQLTETQNLPPAPFTGNNQVLVNSTLRQTVHTTVEGKQLRLRFSNAFGGADLPITKVAVALPLGGKAGVSAIRPGTSKPVTFQGKVSTVVPVGAQVVSDPIALDVAPDSDVTVTMYLAKGQASTNVTSHPGSRTTSYILSGDHVAENDLSGATSTNHWYFLSGLEVWAPSSTGVLAVLGDSLTDGRGSTTNLNNRWPDALFDRLVVRSDIPPTAILNQAAGGNRVLDDGLGPNALARLDRDILVQSGVDRMIVFEGVNDIGTAAATSAAQNQVAADLIDAYDQIIRRAHTLGIRVYGATLLPFGQNIGYDDPAGYRRAARSTVNEWIRTSGRFDAVLDFDRVVRDPDDPEQLKAAYDDGDRLHLNPAGYKALAEAVPTQLFRASALPGDFGFN